MALLIFIFAAINAGAAGIILTVSGWLYIFDTPTLTGKQVTILAIIAVLGAIVCFDVYENLDA